MKVLQTMPYFNKASGGPTSCTHNLLKGLNSVGTTTDLLTFRPQEDDILAREDFVHYLDDDRKTPLWLSSNFKRAIKESVNDYDIVHANTIWTWPIHQAVEEGLRAHKPVVLSPHGMLYPQALKVSAWKKKLIAPLFVNRDLHRVSCIHATSEEEARHIRDYGITLPIAVIPNCIWVEGFPGPRTTTNQKRRIGFVGRLDPIKNVDILLRAWVSLGEKTENAELVIIGGGKEPYEDFLKQYVDKKRCTNVRFCGFLSGQTLLDTVHGFDFLVLPSKSENFGMVVAECLAMGIPAIASTGTPWSALEEIDAGWWIKPDDADLAEAILNALNTDEDHRKLMGLNGRKYVTDKYGATTVAQDMTTLYQWLLGEAPRPDFVI